MDTELYTEAPIFEDGHLSCPTNRGGAKPNEDGIRAHAYGRGRAAPLPSVI